MEVVPYMSVSRDLLGRQLLSMKTTKAYDETPYFPSFDKFVLSADLRYICIHAGGNRRALLGPVT